MRWSVLARLMGTRNQSTRSHPCSSNLLHQTVTICSATGPVPHQELCKLGHLELLTALSSAFFYRRPSAKLPMAFGSAIAIAGVAQLGLAQHSPCRAETVPTHPALLEVSPVLLAVPPIEKNKAALDSGFYPIDVGDRLKISFYGRDDLTAEYRVQPDGQVRIPTLGTFSAAGRTVPELEGAILKAAEQFLNRQYQITVEVIERRPVFVVGLVAKPGSYTFSPDMTVIHAMAVAGGTTTSAAATPWLSVEALRESARLITSKEEMKRLLARQARLRAHRNGLGEIPIPSELIEFAGANEAARLIADEQSVHEQNLARLSREQNTLELVIKEAKTEVDAFERELTKISEQRSIRQAAFDAVQALSNRGLSTLQRLTDAEVMLANIDRDVQGAIANIARSKQNLARAERDLELLKIDSIIQVERDLQAVDEQIAKVHAAMKASASVIQHAASLPASILAQDLNPHFQYEILRKNRDGQLVDLSATETTPLLPGDVVRVSLSKTQLDR